MFRSIGRIVAGVIAVLMIKYSGEFSWWASIALITSGLAILGFSERDYLRSQGRLK